jgi:threonylcarbamoyladenosine tRNA methylthiotransferase MtaB
VTSERAPRVSVRTLGCKVNRAESEALAEELLAAGAELVDPGDAEVIVVNTCTVTGEADAKCRKAVRQALAQPLDPTVVVTGCMAAIDSPSLLELGPRVVVEPDKTRVVQTILAPRVGGGGEGGLLLRQASAGALGAAGSSAAGRRLPRLQNSPQTPSATASAGRPRFRTRVAVKVQDGCEHRCAYCIVPDARGPVRSTPADAIVSRVEDLVASGTAEVVLTGVNLGRYNHINTSLSDLISQVAATGIRRIRLSSIEPLDLTPPFLATLSAIPQVMPHLHVPLQSGCDRTLEAMRRGYDTGAYADALARARKALPGLAVTTDVIAGFPGETDEDFEESFRFVEDIGLAKLHVFRYSKRAGTPAAVMPQQVPPPLKAARAERLRHLSERLERAHARGRVGTSAEVLVERLDGSGAVGTSEDYLRVRIPAVPQGISVGQVLCVRIDVASSAGVQGTIPT